MKKYFIQPNWKNQKVIISIKFISLNIWNSFNNYITLIIFKNTIFFLKNFPNKQKKKTNAIKYQKKTNYLRKIQQIQNKNQIDSKQKWKHRKMKMKTIKKSNNEIKTKKQQNVINNILIHHKKHVIKNKTLSRKNYSKKTINKNLLT